MLKIILLSFTLIAFSCQTNRVAHQKAARSIASGELISKFIKQLSVETKTSTELIEKNIIEYIGSRAGNQNHGNYVAIGITEEQAMQIKSLSDDLPFMPKVRKWAMENMNKIQPSIDLQIAKNVYESIVVAERGVVNPYVIASTSGSMNARRQAISPISSLSEKQERLLKSIRELDNTSVERVYRDNLAAMQLRGKDAPSVLANGQEIVESATLITRKTGLKAMGEGCESFTKNASLEILEAKANLDIYRAYLTEQAAYNKAGRSFASKSDIPKQLRLTQEELDEITKIAFRDVQGYTDDEASAALKRLKGKPCKIY